MNMRKMVLALAAAFALSSASAVYAADNGTEFGIEDDVTVLGTGGTQADPDVEIKGFSIFGSTNVASVNITPAAGNVIFNGQVQVSSGMYVIGGSTFATGAYFTGVSSFAAGPGSIYISGGAADQVLKKVAGGGMVWSNDQGGVSGTGIVDYLPLWKTSADLTNSRVYQAQVSGSTHVYVAADLHLSSSVYFGNGLVISTFTEAGTLSMTSGGDIILTGAGAQVTLPNLPGAASDAANKQYVDNQVSGSGPWTRDNAIGVVKLSTITDNVGVGVAAPLARLHVSSNNASASDYLFIVSSGPLAGNNRFAIQADGTANLSGALTVATDLTVNGNAVLGNAVTDTHAINRAVESGVALSVDSVGTAGNYAAKFYSGGSLAAWIKKK